MPVFLSNPWGLLALLGIPLILLIHLLQRQSKVELCSTLFLLKKTQLESVSGRKIDKVLQSLSLWLQLLAVLLLTLLLVQPRFINKQATQRIAVVLDSSASMLVFKEKLHIAVKEQIPIAKGIAPNMELWVLDSDISKERIYHGNSLEEMSEKLDSWSPNSLSSSPQHSLRVARSLVGRKGEVLFFTDHVIESASYNATVYAIGEKHQNVGFTGVTYTPSEIGTRWAASVKNYSKVPLSREWKVAYSNGTTSESRLLKLRPGELQQVSGIIPSNVERAVVVLSADIFTYDDVLPLLSPIPRSLKVGVAVSEKFQPLASKITKHFDHVSEVADSELLDFVIQNFNAAPAKITPDDSTATSSPTTEINSEAGIWLLDSKLEKSIYKVGQIVASDHTLLEGLNWQQLFISDENRIPIKMNDIPLLWLDKTPILFLRENSDGTELKQQLVFNFDIKRSNIMKQDAFALLLFRYIESQRDNKKDALVSTTELGQVLDVSLFNKIEELTFSSLNLSGEVINKRLIKASTDLISPNKVGFYTIHQGDKLLLTASNYFADTAEADLSLCGSGVLTTSLETSAVEQHSVNDRLWRLWVILLLLAILISWIKRN